LGAKITESAKGLQIPAELVTMRDTAGFNRCSGEILRKIINICADSDEFD